MLNNLNLGIRISNNTKDSHIAKNIIDVLFTFIDDNIRNDKKMNAFTKSLILSQLPSIRNGSKSYVDNMSNVKIEKLLNNVQHELSVRK